MEQLTQDSFVVLALYLISGMIFGSFATALIYRLPRDIDWIKQRSKCTKCNKSLGVLDLIPILSYIINWGKCRHCKTKYGFRYLYIEVLMAISFLIIGYHFGANANSIFLCMLVFAVIVLSVIDFEHYIIPDEVNIFILLLGVGYNLYFELEYEKLWLYPLIYFAIAMCLRWGIYLWKKREGLGLGDVKFFIAAGMWLYIEDLPIFLMLSGLTGIAIAIIWRVLKKGNLFPFGPALSIAMLFCVAFPTQTRELLNSFQELLYSIV